MRPISEGNPDEWFEILVKGDEIMDMATVLRI